ncbi:MAG: hypothetical protein Q4Q58_06195 [Thermoplasmata archaeon]|nr:hypothetical protein [Thermoplasmata archaeon]
MLRNEAKNEIETLNGKRVAFGDLRAQIVEPVDVHVDMRKPRIGYILDDDGNYPDMWGY